MQFIRKSCWYIL